MKEFDPTPAYRFALPTRTEAEKAFLGALEQTARDSATTYVEKFMAFPLWAPRQSVARFLAQWEVFKLVEQVHGSIVECGVAFGGGLMAWAHFASIVDPYCHTRRVVGFDTFEGFTGMSEGDAGAQSGLAEKGGMAVPLADEIERVVGLHDHNRPIGHIARVEIVRGDACDTIRRYVAEHPELVVALLVLDFDVYKPTAAALRWLLPLVPPGGVVLFDELNCRDWPGETLAAWESGLLRKYTPRRCPHTSTMSYVVVQ